MKQMRSSGATPRDVTSCREPDLFSRPSGVDVNEEFSTLAPENSKIPCDYTTGPLQSQSAVTKRERLFVPIGAQPFAWFSSGKKRWEMRRYGRQYTDKHVVPGRIVELRRGYNSQDSLWGRIGRVVRAQNLSRFFEAVPYGEVIPIASSLQDAINIADAFVGADDSVSIIGFEIWLEHERNPSCAPIPAVGAQ
jgi:hypothetical protein